ncbi:hypothetical protein VSX64_19770 [Aurantimonas sp. C2-6-R+9]|uniref:winged helix domain-containing protein n=1 Tax=unclassified Aurantimonas TaxID=2638230 RepID=UPI002E19DB3C|nr:hypothetical protein [Aurantimonas sp. C2-6-R+9]
MTCRYHIRARLLPDGAPITIVGRNADTLEKLLAAGEHGLTTIEYPAPRVAHYIYRLRGMGFVIETIDEAHGGAFPGHHARYVLRSEVQIIQDQIEEAA